MLSRLKFPLNHLRTSCFSYAKWTYVESSPSLTRAEKMRLLNAENKALYGEAAKKKSKKKSIEQPKVPESSNEHDISSEMYWLLGKRPVKRVTSPPPELAEPPNPDDPLNISGLMRTMEAQKPAQSPYSDEISDIKITKKVLSKRKSEKLDQPQLPDTLNKLQSTLPSAQLSPTSSSSDSSESGDEFEANKIPLTIEHLRAMQNFPIIITKTNRIVSSFDSVDQFYYSVPSVSKVLQATMPESQRQALINWKNLKIAELGVEGFDEMQKGELSRPETFQTILSQIHLHRPPQSRQTAPPATSNPLRRTHSQSSRHARHRRHLVKHRAAARQLSSARNTHRNESSSSLSLLSWRRRLRERS